MIAENSLPQRLHAADYAYFLPWIAHLPLPLGYRLAALRGALNARFQRDWRSMALARQGIFRHIARRSREGYAQLIPDADARRLDALVAKRFQAESMEEYEGALISAGRLAELHVEFENLPLRDPQRGLVILTAHYASFVLGYSFLARLGWVINTLSSALVEHPDLASSVRKHFEAKYQCSEQGFNGGRVLFFEAGLKPYFRALARHECLCALVDTPRLASDSGIVLPFVGKPRKLASGAVRLAQKTDSQICAFVCTKTATGRYRVKFSPIGDARDTGAVTAAHDFLSDAILRQPGQWWATDLLPDMPALSI